MRPTVQHQVRAWQFQDVLLEAYEYAPGKAGVSEPHVHNDYQLCLSLDFPGTYAYRGASHSVPKGSLSILHPGERHSSADPEDRGIYAHYRLIYLPRDAFERVVPPSRPKASASPFFPEPVLLDGPLFDDFAHLHRMLGSTATLLEQEHLLQSLLLNLTLRYAAERYALSVIRPEHKALRRVKAYIEDNHHLSIGLNDLARLVDRHPVYLNAMFRQAFGVPPHAYQIQIRIDRARRLLANGVPVGEAAQLVGFYDQSHFGRHFRRYTGVTPARYRACL